MKLLEYEAKQLLETSGITIPKSFIATDTSAFLPAVLKSQVPIGGRGKVGGIIIAHDETEYRDGLQKIAKLEVKGFLPRTILAEEVLDIKRELYLSILIDRVSAEIVLMAHNNGGVEVESQDGFKSWGLGSEGSTNDVIGQELADYFDLPDQTFALQDLVERLWECFIKNDALLLEINPLAVTRDGRLVAGDCKMEVDDATAFRHPDWKFETEKSETNFVTLDPKGNVATIANGAGLAMATVDAVADAGMTPANFLDIGGGASEASVLAAFKRIMEYPDIKVIIINIFAGITRCDEVAKAIIAARDQLPNLAPLSIRLAGTNYEQAAALLAEQNIEIHSSLDAAIINAKGTIS
ncbi:MAG: sucC [Candidatus Saccharibacteria bacterium]|nr:sucC [Candidatus Saccharibacteria bacterium]